MRTTAMLPSGSKTTQTGSPFGALTSCTVPLAYRSKSLSEEIVLCYPNAIKTNPVYAYTDSNNTPRFVFPSTANRVKVSRQVVHNSNSATPCSNGFKYTTIAPDASSAHVESASGSDCRANSISFTRLSCLGSGIAWLAVAPATSDKYSPNIKDQKLNGYFNFASNQSWLL